MTNERRRRKARTKRETMKKRRPPKKRMETAFNLIPIAVVVVVTILALRSTFQSADPGPPAPDFTLEDVITGRQFTLSVGGLDLIVVVTFFDTQCSECRTVLLHLQDLRDELGPDFTIISVAPTTTGDTIESLTNYAIDNDFRWFFAFDPGSLAIAYEGTKRPTTVIIDRNQRIAFREEGAIGFKVLENQVKTLIKDQPRVPSLALNVISKLELLQHPRWDIN